ncbi:hypothetical protein BV20DRAFT_169280 [Pilatotrama ljubarskyi]|nr:hypothetical protein BV20DRAFT_169280 [Pilatotrama ljubarskyi]
MNNSKVEVLARGGHYMQNAPHLLAIGDIQLRRQRIVSESSLVSPLDASKPVSESYIIPVSCPICVDRRLSRLQVRCLDNSGGHYSGYPAPASWVARGHSPSLHHARSTRSGFGCRPLELSLPRHDQLRPACARRGERSDYQAVPANAPRR